ncbi:unnamed protein product, partial [Effrenium voratum]
RIEHQKPSFGRTDLKTFLTEALQDPDLGRQNAISPPVKKMGSGASISEQLQNASQ